MKTLCDTTNQRVTVELDNIKAARQKTLVSLQELMAMSVQNQVRSNN